MKRIIEKALNDLEAKAQTTGYSVAIDAAFNFGVQLAVEVVVEKLEKFDCMLFVDYPDLKRVILDAQKELKI